MIKKTYKVSRKDFLLFKKECQKWIDKLGMKDYEFNFEFGCADGSYAQFIHSYTPRKATIKFTKKMTTVISKYNQIKKTAFHEVFEIMLCRLETKAQSRDEGEEIESERHRIVYSVWNMLRDYYD